MNQIEVIHQAFLLSSGAQTDSRNCSNNEMFFALKGERFDGNKYVNEVLTGGAAYAVSDSKDNEGLKNVFYVDNVLQTLQDLALFHRRYLNIPIIAITGTNGKTTTKELLKVVLSKKFNVKATAGNFNNHIGVPLTLLSMDDSIEIGVVEMGANHIGEIEFLCNIAEPNFGLITNVGKAHLEGFGSFEGVKIAKGELYNYLRKNGGQIFINVDNDHLLEMAKTIPTLITYGTKSGKVKGCVTNNEPYLAFTWNSSLKAVAQIYSNLIGVYNLENILAAISLGNFFGVSDIDIKEAIEAYNPTNNRSQFITTNTNKIIMDAYNANPSSMKVALENFDKVNGANKVVILGGMKELGDDSFVEHQELVNALVSMEVDKVILIGDEFVNTVPEGSDQIFSYKDNQNFIDDLEKSALEESYILIKGSRSNQLEQLLKYL